jgi:hypothetical protein
MIWRNPDSDTKLLLGALLILVIAVGIISLLGWAGLSLANLIGLSSIVPTYFNSFVTGVISIVMLVLLTGSNAKEDEYE